MMVFLFICITLVYLFLIGSLALGFDKVKEFYLEDISSNTLFSIIIPFRNEAKNLPSLLQSIRELQYPKDLFEVIFVDDASTDNSLEIVNTFISKTTLNIITIKNNRETNAPKKEAITSAILLAKNEWIVTTDADCKLPKFWLDTFDAYIQKNKPSFIVAPVTYEAADSFLKRFQLLDFLSLQGATIGGFGMRKPFLCNGANLAYKKTLFESLNGFHGNTNIASGDDIFMLEKVLNKNPESVHYLKNQNAIVSTTAEATIRGLMSQRVRWASKTTMSKNRITKSIGFTILLMNTSIISLFVLSVTGTFSFKFFLYLFIIKLSIDFLLLYKMARFFKQETYLSSYALCSVLYPFFSVYIVFVSVFTGYKWKGRTFSK
jgi:glycosyltransferase involved in cell wall biosynthesis